jgi:hypothetical protein
MPIKLTFTKYTGAGKEEPVVLKGIRQGLVVKNWRSAEQTVYGWLGKFMVNGGVGIASVNWFIKPPHHEASLRIYPQDDERKGGFYWHIVLHDLLVRGEYVDSDMTLRTNPTQRLVAAGTKLIVADDPILDDPKGHYRLVFPNPEPCGEEVFAKRHQLRRTTA